MPNTPQDFLERITPLVREGGARNIVELANTLKIPVETTRYRVKGMMKQGLVIYASVDYEKFGLANVEGNLFLSPKAQQQDKKFFQALAEDCYLTSFGRIVPSNSYACTFAIPENSQSDLRRLARILTEEDLIISSNLEVASSRRNYTIRPGYFHLKRGTWSIDWSRVRRHHASVAPREKSKSNERQFDDLDLRITRQLEQDALIRLSDIASSFKMTLNNIFYHFHKHILKERLVDGFGIRWNGNSKQEYVFVQYVFNKLSFAEEKNVQELFSRIPFLWSDAQSVDSGYYSAKAMVPTSQYLDSLKYLSSELGETAKKLVVDLIDPRTRQSFPIPSHLFKDGNWQFDPEVSASKVALKLKR
ncbi:MAG: hypothetical protein ACYCQJ_00780 [Nitrososphaerales archaeon]